MPLRYGGSHSSYGLATPARILGVSEEQVREFTLANLVINTDYYVENEEIRFTELQKDEVIRRYLETLRNSSADTATHDKPQDPKNWPETLALVKVVREKFGSFNAWNAQFNPLLPEEWALEQRLRQEKLNESIGNLLRYHLGGKQRKSKK